MEITIFGREMVINHLEIGNFQLPCQRTRGQLISQTYHIGSYGKPSSTYGRLLFGPRFAQWFVSQRRPLQSVRPSHKGNLVMLAMLILFYPNMEPQATILPTDAFPFKIELNVNYKICFSLNWLVLDTFSLTITLLYDQRFLNSSPLQDRCPRGEPIPPSLRFLGR